ncbi:MAG: response regulator [Deltaproteobacteria bacterium]
MKDPMEELRDTVLVIEDDAALRGSFRASLKRFGYDVAEAENGEVGLQAALAVPPSVILLDLRMPRMDGHTSSLATPRTRSCITEYSTPASRFSPSQLFRTRC